MPPPTMTTSWRESVMNDDHTATFRLTLRLHWFTTLIHADSQLLVHDQGYGGRRCMTQRARGARDGDGIGAGLRALLLPPPPPPPPPPLLPPPPQEASKSASRDNPSREAGRVSLACFLTTRLCLPVAQVRAVPAKRRKTRRQRPGRLRRGGWPSWRGGDCQHDRDSRSCCPESPG